MIKIVSGGQTGVDRAALDVALEKGISIGGYAPLGRLAEDGRIADRYTGLIETRSADKLERTALNVRRSDATLIISHGPLTRGSMLTAELARGYQKPLLHIDLDTVAIDAAIEMIRSWLEEQNCKTLNIAGPPVSIDPGIYDDASSLLRAVFDE